MKTETKENNSRKEARKIFKNKYPLLMNFDIVVHHVNGNPLDNRLTNLMPLSRKDHYKAHTQEGGLRYWPTGKKQTDIEKVKQLESLIKLYNIGWFVDIIPLSK